jgi:hypothetical protein
MARQDIDAAKHVLIEKIGLTGDKADRVVIDQLGIHHGGIVNPAEGGIDQWAFDHLDAEQDIFAGQGMAILKGGVAADFKSIGKLVGRDDGSRFCKQGLKLERARVAGKKTLKYIP